MRLAWLQHLLADRGIDGTRIVSMSITAGQSKDSELYLDLVTYGGKVLWDNDKTTYGPLHERRLIPIGGMVFDVADTADASPSHDA